MIIFCKKVRRIGESQSFSQVNDILFSVLTEVLLMIQNHEKKIQGTLMFPEQACWKSPSPVYLWNLPCIVPLWNTIPSTEWVSKIFLDDAKRLQWILSFCILWIKIVTHIHCLKGISLLCIYIKEFPSPTAMEITNCLMQQLVLMCPSVSLPASCFDGL